MKQDQNIPCCLRIVTTVSICIINHIKVFKLGKASAIEKKIGKFHFLTNSSDINVHTKSEQNTFQERSVSYYYYFQNVHLVNKEIGPLKKAAIRLMADQCKKKKKKRIMTILFFT